MASKVHQTITPSHTHAHKAAKPIDNHAHNQTTQIIASLEIIVKATTKPYIAADSTNAIHKIVTVKKNIDKLGLLPITIIDFLDIIHSPIPTHNQANQIANHAHTQASPAN
jgi:hypothetical protein